MHLFHQMTHMRHAGPFQRTGADAFIFDRFADEPALSLAEGFLSQILGIRDVADDPVNLQEDAAKVFLNEPARKK